MQYMQTINVEGYPYSIWIHVDNEKFMNWAHACQKTPRIKERKHDFSFEFQFWISLRKYELKTLFTSYSYEFNQYKNY